MTKPDSPPIVLVVEDEMVLRMRAVDIVEDAGFTPIEAISADQAIEILESRDDISLLFTDVQMPGSMDGLKLAHATHARWPHIKIILVSGQIAVTDEDKPEDSKFFPKPLEIQHMISEIQEILNGALRPRYFARVEERVYVTDEADPFAQVFSRHVGGKKPLLVFSKTQQIEALADGINSRRQMIVALFYCRATLMPKPTHFTAQPQCCFCHPAGSQRIADCQIRAKAGRCRGECVHSVQATAGVVVACAPLTRTIR